MGLLFHGGDISSGNGTFTCTFAFGKSKNTWVDNNNNQQLWTGQLLLSVVQLDGIG